MAELRFTPDRFIEAGKRAAVLHERKDAYDFSRPDEQLFGLIRRLLQTPEDMLKPTAMALSDRSVKMVAGYLPHDFLNQPEDKLIEILKYRIDEGTCEVLFREWQDDFTNPQCNRYLRTLTDSNGYFQKLLGKYHISREIFSRILSSRSIPLSWDQNLVGGMFSDGEEFDRKLRYYGVDERSYLDVECKRALLAFCEKEDYFSCSEENLLEVMKTYDTYLLRIMVFNFISKLSLPELEDYPAIASYMRQITGHQNSGSFQEFFEGIPEHIIMKYIDWINIFKINLYFDGDERSQFWKQYRCLNVIRYPVSNVVILEFDEYVVVEFLGNRRGIIYLCDKNIFMQQVYNKLDRVDNEELRAWFKANKDLCEESRNHLGRWQSHMGNVIARKEITEKWRP